MNSKHISLIFIALTGFAFSVSGADDLDEALSRLERASVIRGAPIAPDGASIIGQAQTPAAPKATRSQPEVTTTITPPVVPPVANTQVEAKAETKSGTVWPLDPRQRINQDQGVKEGYEMTTLSVQRVFTAACYSNGNEKADWSQRLPITVPVLYPTRTLRITQENTAKCREVLRRLQALKLKSEELKSESERLLAEWNSIVDVSTPVDTLFADSVTLTTNQSDSVSNRKTTPAFQPGQGVTYTINEE